MSIRRTALAAGALALGAMLLLSACSSGSTADPKATVAAAGDISKCDPAKSTINAVFGQQATDAMTVAAAALQKKYPGLTINATPQATASYDDLTKTVVADIAVGKRPDLVMTGLGQLKFWVQTYKPQPIDPDALASTYQKQFLDAGTVDGKVYLAPAQISAPVLIVNKDLLASAGVNPEKLQTFDELVAGAEKVTAKTGAPSVSVSTDSLADWFAQAFVQGSGADFVKADGSAGIDSAKAIKALSVWENLSKKHLELGVGLQDASAAFIGGKAAFFVTTTSLIASLNKGIGTHFDWEPVDLPSVGGEGGPLPAGGNGWVVLSKDSCNAAFSTALVAQLLGTDAVLKASGAGYSYIPVDTAAGKQLLGSSAVTPQLKYAWSYNKKLSPWGGFDGTKTVQVNDTFRTMAQKLATGSDTASTVKAAAKTIDQIVGK